MTNALRSLWVEARPPPAPGPVRRDRTLIAVLVVAAVLEGVLRPEVDWRLVSTGVALLLPVALRWRRRAPLVVLGVVFAVLASTSVVTLTTGLEPGLYSMAWSLLLPYALLRWGSGREAVIGLVIVVAVGILGVAADDTDLAEGVAGMAFLLSPALIGASVRYRSNVHLRDLDQVRVREREQLARELHDTVAHHVSAIAIQAQAGRVVLDADPARAAAALEVIEESASRALVEMRKMVGVLRDGEQPQLAPQRGVADISRLARDAGDWPRVDVELAGDLEDLSPSVGAAVYRLVQESITNASRHARNATRISVAVSGDTDCVRLSVRDDGDATPAGRTTPGYGLIGMTERASLLGGTLVAGPGADRGWSVDAVLPRAGARR